MDLKTIALDSRPTVDELNEFKRGTSDGLRGESAATDTGKEYWTSTGATVDSLVAGRAGMKLLDNPGILRIQNGR